jgi:hypothetical protein
MIGYFWVYLGLTLKARELIEAEREVSVAAPVPPPRQFAQPRSAADG